MHQMYHAVESQRQRGILWWTGSETNQGKDGGAGRTPLTSQTLSEKGEVGEEGREHHMTWRRRPITRKFARCRGENISKTLFKSRIDKNLTTRKRPQTPRIHILTEKNDNQLQHSSITSFLRSYDQAPLKRKRIHQSIDHFPCIRPFSRNRLKACGKEGKGGWR